QQEERDTLVALLHVVVGTRQQQDVVGDVRRGAPRLVAVEDPPAVGLLRARAHAAEDVGPAARLAEADREAQLALGDLRQQALLLLVAAVDTDRLRAGERR